MGTQSICCLWELVYAHVSSISHSLVCCCPSIRSFISPSASRSHSCKARIECDFAQSGGKGAISCRITLACKYSQRVWLSATIQCYLRYCIGPSKGIGLEIYPPSRRHSGCCVSTQSCSFTCVRNSSGKNTSTCTHSAPKRSPSNPRGWKRWVPPSMESHTFFHSENTLSPCLPLMAGSTP